MCIPPEVVSLCKDNTEKKYYYKALKAEKNSYFHKFVLSKIDFY